MNYIGSKLKLLNFIETTVQNVVGKDLTSKVFCDLFAGTGIVGRHFKPLTRQIIANDLEYYSFVLNKNYVENQLVDKQNEWMSELNALSPVSNGLIYQYYCSGSNSGRNYFSNENGQKIDAVRGYVEKIFKTGNISDETYYFLLASLLESADKVANTASVYGAFLKHIKKTAAQPLLLTPATFLRDNKKHRVFNENSNQLIHKISGDILYLDPPYNARQYGANYHLLNTIADYKPFEPSGKTGLRPYQKSKYCSRRTISEEFEELIKNAQFQYIFLSYNNEGLMSLDETRKIMQKYGKYDLEKTVYQRFKADKTENRNHKSTQTEEYIHILIKNR